MKIIITGGRHYADQSAVWNFLDQLLDYLCGDLTVIQGGADGADKFARNWCMRRGVNFKNYPYPSGFGRRGGPIRNREMAVKEQPELVVSFPGGKGTRSMCTIATELGIHVINAGIADVAEEPVKPKFIPRYVQPKGL